MIKTNHFKLHYVLLVLLSIILCFYFHYKYAPVVTLHIKHPDDILFLCFMLCGKHLWRYFKGIILEMQKADGRWESIHAAHWPMGMARRLNPTLCLDPAANQSGPFNQL